jgi:hypothetical protein
VLEREEIYQRVWGYTMAHGDRSVDVFVRKLRSKFQQVSPGWNYIHTHFGVGYRFAAEPAGEAPAVVAATVPRSVDWLGGAPVAPAAPAEPQAKAAAAPKAVRAFA